MALVIREGDPTTTGGVVVAGSSTHNIEFRKAARISDPVWCPACKSMGFIAEGNPTVIDEYLALATHGHAVQCGCPFGSNRLIATQSTVVAARQGTIGIAPELALQAEAATLVWAKAIRDGSYVSQYTAGIPTHQVRGLSPVAPCVFAKSCSVPQGSTEAGTTTEPAENFGRVAVLGTVAESAGGSAGNGGTAATGAVALGRVAGQSVLEGLGWSIRGAAAAAGSSLSTLLLALWSPNLGDSAVYSEGELRRLSAAATRVRFQFRRDADGVVRVYGLHTGNGSVPVVEARWNDGKHAMEAQLGGVTIVWTPNEGPVLTAPTSYPGVTEALDTLLVYPIPEGQDSRIAHYPGREAEDITWQDTIITFPADSGVPPLYLVFAKPAVQPLEVGLYRDLTSRSRRDGLDIDHIPSRMALDQYLRASDPDLSDYEIKQLLLNAPSIAIPASVHQKYSETYGGRNTQTKRIKDAANLRSAVDRNFDAIKPGLLEEGFTEAEIESARTELHDLHQEQGWY